MRPEEAHRWVELGRHWVKEARRTADPGYYVNAEACAAVALDVAPEHEAALNLRALTALNDHSFRDALAFAERVLARDPDDPAAWGTVSDALLELGDISGARRAAQRMLDLKPNLLSYARAAYIRWLHGDTEGAIKLSRAAIVAGRQASDREPLAWTIVQTATFFWHQGDLAGADAGYELALEAVDDYPAALVGKARVALAQDEPRAAIIALEKALARHSSIEAMWLLTEAHRAAGNETAARQVSARLLAEGPRSDPRTLADFLATSRRDVARAIALARTEYRERPSLYTADVLAWALYRDGQFDEAQRLTEKAVRIGTPDARLLFHAGAIRIAAGKRQVGRQLVARALDANPRFDPVEAIEAQRLLDRSGTS